MFMPSSTLASGADDAAPPSDADSEDFETMSMSSQYTLELDSSILDTLTPLTRVGGRHFLQATKTGPDFTERGFDLFSLYQDDDEADDSPEDEEVFSGAEGSFDKYDLDLACDNLESERPSGNKGIIEGSDDGSEENEWDHQTEVPFSRNQSWEHVWKPATSDVCAGPLFVRSQLDNLIDEIKPVHCDTQLDLISIPDDVHVTRMVSSSRAARIAILLNSSERRRDPWNVSLPTEIFLADSQEYHALSSLSTDFSVPKKITDWAFLVQRSWGNAENAYYRTWNDPPLSTVRDCFDLVQQLLEGMVFFHEQGLSRIPFLASNIVMDIGLAPYLPSHHGTDAKQDPSHAAAHTPLDRATYPVKYYIASLDNLRFVSQGSDDGTDDTSDSATEYARDIVNLGVLIKELFSSIPGDPLEVLYNFMHFPTATNSPLATSTRSDDASAAMNPLSSGPPLVVRPTASSALELFHFIQARCKEMGKNITQPPEVLALIPHEANGGGGYSQTRRAAQDTHVLDEAHGIGVGKLTHEKG